MSRQKRFIPGFGESLLQEGQLWLANADYENCEPPLGGGPQDEKSDIVEP